MTASAGVKSAVSLAIYRREGRLDLNFRKYEGESKGTQQPLNLLA